MSATMQAAARPIDTQRRRDRRTAGLAGCAVAVCGFGVLVLHYFNGRPHGNGDPEGWFASIGFAAPFVAAGLLAILGSLLDTPWLWWSAGVALIPCSIVSIVLFPLLLPVAALITIGFRNERGGIRSAWGAVLAVALNVSFMVIVFHQDQATWAGGSSSNVITSTEATLSVATAVCVLVVGWPVAAAPPRRRP